MRSKRLKRLGLAAPIANVSFAMMHSYVKSVQRSGVSMMHTARSFSYYRKVFYKNRSKAAVLAGLEGNRVVDIGCGYTPFAKDSMFRACHDRGIEFYGVDPVIASDLKFGIKERAMAIATGGSGVFSANAPGLERALSARAEKLPFDDESIDEILCSYLLFVWIEGEEDLADILGEFLRVLKPGGVVKLYPLYDWRYMRIKQARLKNTVANFRIEQTFVHGGRDMRVTPSLLTEMTKVNLQSEH